MTNSKNTNPKNDNAKEEVKTGTSQLKKIVMQAIDELDDTKVTYASHIIIDTQS